MLDPAEEDYLDAVADLSEDYEREIKALRQQLASVDQSKPAAGQGHMRVANRIKALGERARKIEAPPSLLESHRAYIEGVAEFDVAMDQILATAKTTDDRELDAAPRLVLSHLQAGYRLVGEATTILRRNLGA